ncbi:MAG TPA: tetratricopeptide repeat protein [Planctomycetota bacterium]|nr:tetratricopeptide repeat protein [Planctomycetota bacterium]
MILAFLLALLPQEDAVEWNRKGIDHLEKEELGAAVEAFEKARALRPEDATIRKNLAVAKFKIGEKAREAKEVEKAAAAFRAAADLDPDFPRFRVHLASAERAAGRGESARQILEDTVKKFPKEGSAFELLGDLDLEEGRLEEAVAALEKALALDPDRPRLRQALERAKRDVELEAGYAREGSGHFDFRYDVGRADLARGAGILGEMLDRAWEDVALELGEWPKERFQVVLYAGNAFREVTGTGEWVGGLFDGRIRVPIGSLFSQREALPPVLRHEVTHAFLHRMAPGLPTWAGEGLAQRLEGRDARMADGAVRAARDRLLGAAELRGSFLELKEPTRIRLAYAMSLSFTDWLYRTRGREAFLRYVRGIRESGEEKASADAFGFSFVEALALWREELGI